MGEFFCRPIQLALVLRRIHGTWEKILVCLNVSAYLRWKRKAFVQEESLVDLLCM